MKGIELLPRTLIFIPSQPAELWYYQLMNSFILTSQSFKDLHYQVEKIKGLKKF